MDFSDIPKAKLSELQLMKGQEINKKHMKSKWQSIIHLSARKLSIKRDDQPTIQRKMVSTLLPQPDVQPQQFLEQQFQKETISSKSLLDSLELTMKISFRTGQRKQEGIFSYASSEFWEESSGDTLSSTELPAEENVVDNEYLYLILFCFV